MDLRATLQQALRLHQTGNLAEAERMYRAVLSQQPFNATALHHLGMLAHQAGHVGPGLDLIAQSVALDPGNVAFRVNQIGLLDSANKRVAAEEGARRLVADRPTDAKIRADYARLLTKYGKYTAAAEEWEKVLALAPRDPGVLFHSAMAQEQIGNRDLTVQRLETAVEVAPNFGEAVSQLADAVLRKGQRERYVALLERAASLLPQDDAVLAKLAAARIEQGRLEEALNVAKSAFDRAPWSPNAAQAYANASLACGDPARAADLYSRATELAPNPMEAYGCLLYSRLYLDSSGEQDLRQHLVFQQQCAQRIPFRPAPARTRAAGERLRIGYISPDFHAHPVGYFIAPLLAHHDKTKFEVHCFSNTVSEDELTDRIRGTIEHFHRLDKSVTTFEELDALIRAKGIDILIDLAGHTNSNCLALLARKPAPVQINYLGYPCTTGLSAIDFRITDVVADPPEHDAFYAEKLLRLPGSFGLFQPPPEAPPVRKSPHEQNGYVTFGSLARVEKWSPATLESWSRILAAVPSAKLRLVGTGFTEPGFVKSIQAKLSAHGIDPSRLQLVGRLPFKEYLAEIGSIDLLLDTNPFNNHTTTLQALYMGVPTVTLAGKLHRSRMGASLMTALGRPELIANSTAEYQRIAIDLAQNPSRLSQLRNTLREQLLSSSLCDGPGFARAFEALLVYAWDNRKVGQSGWDVT